MSNDNWIWQLRMMDALITGLEQALVGFTVCTFVLLIDYKIFSRILAMEL
jgi:hypothetical protein